MPVRDVPAPIDNPSAKAEPKGPVAHSRLVAPYARAAPQKASTKSQASSARWARKRPGLCRRAKYASGVTTR